MIGDVQLDGLALCTGASLPERRSHNRREYHFIADAAGQNHDPVILLLQQPPFEIRYHLKTPPLFR